MATSIITPSLPPKPPQAPAEPRGDLILHTGEPARGPKDMFIAGTRAVGQVVTAPLKICLTPLAGLTVGTGLGCVRGLHMGTVLPLLFATVAADTSMRVGEDRRSPLQRGFEDGVQLACCVTLLIVAVPVCAATGVVLGAATGAATGTAHGLREGYQASWRGDMPSLTGYIKSNQNMF